MNEDTKKALEEFRKAKEEVDKIIFTEYDTAEEIKAVSVTLEKEKMAYKKYRILLYQDRGFTEKKIDELLKIEGLL